MPETTTPLLLRLARKEQIASEVYLFELQRPGSGELPPFTPGAHISVVTPTGAVRKYSLCNDPAERDRYTVAVKSEGSGANSLIDDLQVGDEVRVSEPRNDFELPRNAQNFLFIAGGIGITPVMSMIRHLRSQPGKNFRLYYLTRSTEMTPFREELSAPDLAGRVVIHHDHGDPAQSYDLAPLLRERQNREHLYCCGPRPLLQTVRELTGHWSPTAVHFEAFSGPERTKTGDAPFDVTLARSGETFTVPVGTTIMEAMRRRGHDVPSSCETGTCGTCRTRLIAGEADHRDLFLTDEDRKTNIMICVSRAKSPKLTLDR